MPQVARPIILGFDTSGPYCGTAVFVGGDVVAAQTVDMAKGQAEALMPMIGATLAEAGTTAPELNAIAVGIGPGNFTGVRIAVSAARGMALALGIPAVGVSLLEALACAQEGRVLASLDARQDRLYLQRFGAEVARGPELVAWADVADWTVPNLMCIGDRATDIAPLVGGEPRPAAGAPACAIARIAAQRLARGETDGRPAPMYLRPADAAPARDTGPRLLP